MRPDEIVADGQGTIILSSSDCEGICFAYEGLQDIGDSVSDVAIVQDAEIISMIGQTFVDNSVGVTDVFG